MRPGVKNHLLAISALGLAVIVRWALDPVLGNALPVVTMFGAIALAVWVGGWRPAVTVAILGYLACSVLFIEPRGTITMDTARLATGLAAYLFTSGLIIAIGEAMRRAQAQASERSETLRVTLASIGDAVITTDVDGRVTYLNAVAESLTGWTQREAAGRPLDEVFHIVNEDSRRPVANPATRALREGVVVGLANHTVLIRRGGGEALPIDDSAAPIRDEQGRVSGCVLIFRDVTAQRRTARDKAGELHTARLLASIVESSDDAIVSKSLDGIIQTWNAAAERMFGFDAAEAIGRHISLVIPPDRLAEEEHIISTLKSGGRIDHFETERMRKDGQPILVSLSVSPLRDDAGKVIGASKVARDITRQRQAEERERQLLAAAAAANVKFHAFFEQGALFAGIMELDGTLVEANRLSWEGCGFTREQVVGKPFWDGPWWSPSAALVQRIKAATTQAAGGTIFRAELPYFVGSGEQRIADVTIQPIRDESGKVLFLAPSSTDITDRKRAEADRQKFVTLVETSPDFIGISDLQGVPFYVNRAGLEMVGLADLEAARRVKVVEFFFPEDQPRIIGEFLPRVLAQGRGEIEVRFRHFGTGEARWMAYKVVVLPDAEGRPAAFATVSQDVTERKQLADNLRSLAADLSEANRRKTEFLAMLAHELRNPLAPISNAVRALHTGGHDQQVVQSTLEMLERQVRQLGRLVDDLLDLSRVTRGKIALRKEPVELAPIVAQTVEATRALYGSLNHQLSVSLPPQPLYLFADAARLAQVISNLLNNACKFTDQGGRVGLTVTQQDGQAIIRVRDDGIGISADQLPHLFDMFTQVDTSLERTRDGLGIGLTLVKSLVEMHGGTVEARSEGLGRGSEFEVRLPVLAQPPHAASAPDAPDAQPAATPAPSRRILIVDDNLDGADSLAMLLEDYGHETHKAHDGLEALEAAERVRPDAILLDIGLPKLNGYEVCRRLREQPWGKQLMVVALTGWGQEEDRNRSQAAGFDSHLVKPVDLDLLNALLASLPDVREPSAHRSGPLSPVSPSPREGEGPG